MDTVFLALRVIVSLAVVIGAIWFVQKRVGRGGHGKSKSKPVSVVTRQSVGAKASVAVVEFDGKRFLLGVTEHAVSVLDSGVILAEEAVEETVEEAVEVEEPAVVGGTDFAAALSEAQSDVPVTPKPAALKPAAAKPAASQPAPSRLAGSVLSAATWRQAFTALRGER